MQVNKNKYFLWGGAFLLIIFLVIFFLIFKGGGDSHYDSREESCIGKNIKSVEYNIDEKKCFETEISACQKPSFTSIQECKKMNGIK